jgi:serine/threonine-protein kinase
MTGPGTLIADRYRVVRHLGSGAMASVELAEDQLLGRQVAIKSVHADPKSEFGRRVLREAQMGAALGHPSLVAVFDTILAEDALLIVMEYVPGRTLAAELEDGRMEPPRALSILRALAEALDHIHAAGIVHRDVKPANVLLHERGGVKLADLGIATSDQVSRITRTGGVVGTAAYMAPEQFESGPVDGSADVYALAAVAFEMLAGRRAFPAGDPRAALLQRDGEPPDLRELVPGTPDAAAVALQRGMARAPGDRPITAAAFVDELQAAYAPAPRGGGITERSPAPAPSRAPRRAVPAAALGLLLVAGVALAIVLASRGDPAAAPETRARTAPERTSTTPAAQPAATAATPTGAVRTFYEQAADGDLDAAWALAGPGAREQFGGSRSSFDRTLGSLRDIRFDRVEQTARSGATATVAITTVATHDDRTERCTGELRTRRDTPGRWLVDRVGVRCDRAS